MTQAALVSPILKFLEDRWNSDVADTLDEPELLRYRSNLLGSDLRITNFAGGNTSSKIVEVDPLNGEPVEVLWVKGSGGDLGSIKRTGFATLYQEKFLSLERSYKGVDTEDDMVAMYALCTFRNNPVAASIDTPLHGFLPFPHVDHLHPDWGIALAASGNGKVKMEQFNREFGHALVWVPWQRPGFELGLMLRRVVLDNPGCDGIVLGGHGLFTWGETQRECYMNTLTVIDQIGQFISRHGIAEGETRFGGEGTQTRTNRKQLAVEIAPYLRGRVSAQNRWIASFSDGDDVLQFVNSAHAKDLAYSGTSCPDHFIRTKIRPLFVPWAAGSSVEELKAQIDISLGEYREQYGDYYRRFASADSPALRDPNPTVVLIPGLGMYSFGKNKTEARIVGEFYTNAIHVMEGASLLAEGEVTGTLPQCGESMDPASFRVFTNYVALPPIEAFRIEYWAMEEAKIRRQPPEKQLSRHVAFVVGAGDGIGRETALLAAAHGAHVMVADNDEAAAARVARELTSVTQKEFVASTGIDLRSRDSIAQALNATVVAFGGLDILIKTAVLIPSFAESSTADAKSTIAPDEDGTADNALADAVGELFAEQGLGGSIVFVSPASTDIARHGDAANGASESSLSHLVHALAASMAPKVRVNGLSLATVADPADCAEAALFLASPRSRSTSGQVLTVGGPN